MSDIIFSENDYQLGQLLQCPVCKGEFDYLHHFKVEVRVRDGEDHDGTLTTVSADGTVTVARVKEADIPGRRDSLDIHFFCENGCDLTLRILQHKGGTFMRWVKAEPSKTDEENEELDWPKEPSKGKL